MIFTEGNVTVMISNMARSLKFYTKTLGLKLQFKAPHGEWAEVKGPGLVIGLHRTYGHGPRPGKSESLSIGFTVRSLGKAMSLLKKKGVRFSPQIMDEGPVRLAFFTDPDGTPLYLCEVKP